MSKENSQMTVDMVEPQEPTKERVENHETRRKLSENGTKSFKAKGGKITAVQNYYGDEQLIGLPYHELYMKEFLGSLPEFEQNRGPIIKNQSKQKLPKNSEGIKVK